jgi:Mg2+ and Co2+ transporter CorA
VENRIDLFRKAWERELNALMAEIQVIKPTYRESFKTMEEFLDTAITQIRSSTSFEEIEGVAREAQGDALYKAQDAIENLKYRLDLKLRLAVSKLLGMGLTIPSEVQAAIQELTQIVPASETYEEAIRKAHHIVELFEKRIVGYFNQTLNEQIKAFSELTSVSATLGIKTDTYVKQSMKLQDKLPANIEELPDRFDELRELLTDAKLLKDIRSKANEVWRNLNSVTDLLERHGQAEIVVKLKDLLARVPDALDANQVNTVLEICMALIEAQNSVLDILRNMEQKTESAFEQLLENTTEYYSTIKRVYASRPTEFSKIIFPIDTLQNLRGKLETVTSLPEAIDIFTTIRSLEQQWLEKIKELDEWHKALRVFLADFNPAAPKAERNRQLNEIEKRIRETYTREDTANYLTWAARELGAVMVEQKEKAKKK